MTVTVTIRYFGDHGVEGTNVVLNATDAATVEAAVEEFEHKIALVDSVWHGDRCLHQSAVQLGEV